MDVCVPRTPRQDISSEYQSRHLKKFNEFTVNEVSRPQDILFPSQVLDLETLVNSGEPDSVSNYLLKQNEYLRKQQMMAHLKGVKLIEKAIQPLFQQLDNDVLVGAASSDLAPGSGSLPESCPE